MPFSRPTLSDLRNQVAQDIASAVPGADALLRFSNLRIIGDALAGLAYLHYGYLDWIAKQSVPFTADEEFLEAWAALKKVYRKSAASASGVVTFSASSGAVVPAGIGITRSDGVAYTSTADATESGGTVAVSATADADQSGQTGAFGNADVGTSMSLASAVTGVQSTGSVTTAFIGGADIETDDAFRSRMLEVYQAPPQGGAEADYVEWAKDISGVTRAWCVANESGNGSVAVYFMMDEAEVAHGGFPQGADGVATDESRATAATGDQLIVADAIFPLRPVTALVYCKAPVANTVDVTISGIATASSATKAAISAAITAVFYAFGTVSASATNVPLSAIESAIAAISGTEGFLITTPSGNVTSAAGELPVLGTVTYT